MKTFHIRKNALKGIKERLNDVDLDRLSAGDDLTFSVSRGFEKKPVLKIVIEEESNYIW